MKMDAPLRVLLVEDSEDDAELMLRELRKGGYELRYQRIETAEEMRTALDREEWDLILSDHRLPNFSSIGALALLQNSGLDLPFIIVSGTMGEETAVAAMKAGANDYVMKGSLARLCPAVERELREAEVRRSRREAEKKEHILYQGLEEKHRQLTQYVKELGALNGLFREYLPQRSMVSRAFGEVLEGLQELAHETGALVGRARGQSGVADGHSAAQGSDELAAAAHALIAGLDSVGLAGFSVVRGYARYDEGTRNALKDARQNIAEGFARSARRRENHLLWAPPGSGKTYFVQQVGESLSSEGQYRELNLAKLSHEEFLAAIREIDIRTEPILCLVDEIDAKPAEAWPYEVLLPYMDATVDPQPRLVVVLAGSSGSSLSEMKLHIASRPKGADLLNRIPGTNEYEIPGLSIGDQMLVVLSQFKQAGQEARKDIRAVEKLGLYYVALNARLGSARQLRELAVLAIERVPPGEDRVKYDHLFAPGDPENKAFWMEASGGAADLVNRFVAMET